jgi:hypothetical protein
MVRGVAFTLGQAMARFTVTTTAVKIAETPSTGGTGDDWGSRSFGLFAQASTGTLLLERSTTGSAPSMTNASRWDVSRLAGVSYTCEPGVSLWAATASGTVDIDVLQGGER